LLTCPVVFRQEPFVSQKKDIHITSDLVCVVILYISSPDSYLKMMHKCIRASRENAASDILLLAFFSGKVIIFIRSSFIRNKQGISCDF